MRLMLTLFVVLSFACGGSQSGNADRPPLSESAGAEARPAPEPEARRLSDDEAAQARTQALQTHTLAGQAYALCMERHEMGDCVRAQGLYGVAADTWLSLLRGRAGDADAPEWRFMHAQALFRADHFAEAADAFERHLDQGVPEEWVAQAAFMLVVANEHLVDEAIARGDLSRRRSPPDASGEPAQLHALDIPPAIARLDAARARYVSLVDDAHDGEQRRRQYALDHALSLYMYGHFDAALPELTEVFEAGCAGDGAWQGGRAAWLALRQVAIRRGQLDALRELGQRLDSDACTFGGEPADCATDAQHPMCLARVDASHIRQVGGRRFMQRAQHARGAERVRWATQAGETYLASLETEPEPGPFTRAETLAHAVTAFELAGAAERVATVDAELMALEPGSFEGAEREFVVQEVARAIGRRLEVARAAEDARRVVVLAARLLDPALDSPDLIAERQSARTLLAQAHASLGHHREAAAAYRALAENATEPSVERDGILEAALEQQRARGCRRGRAGLSEFVGTYTAQAGARESVLHALWVLASCERSGSEGYFRVLSRMNAARSSTSGRLSVETRAHAAEAAFRLADRDFTDVTRLHMRLPRVEQVEEFTGQITEQLAEPAARVGELVRAYEAVEPLGAREWSVAAATRAAAVVQALMTAIEHAQWSLPTSVQRALPRLSRVASQQIRQGTEARIHELLEQQAERLRCSAAARYAHAAELAGRDLHSDYADEARRAFGAIDADVLERCRQRNPSLFN